MRLGLLDSLQPFEDERGVVRLDGHQLDVVDLNTEERVENVAGMIWGPGAILVDPLPEEGLFTPQHFDRTKDYLVIVVECPAALSVGRRKKV